MSESEAQLPRLGLREPLGEVINDADSLARACAELSLGHGPIGLDAERASGYRYSQRAYLVQVRREGVGSFLIDPIAFDNLVDLDEAFADSEWILHAATQDLPCLTDVGMRPQALFDTELAGRLLNLPRVGLSSLVEHYLGLSLAKEFSAVDWSTRPLPEPWLEYAALDVEVLVELRELEIADLEKSGKIEWARQEFESLLGFTGPAPRVDPWRRTSGIHKLRSRRALAVVKTLWEARDQIAADRDVTPGRVIHDSLILKMAQETPGTMAELKSNSAMKSRGARRYISQWFDAIESALTLDEEDLPRAAGRGTGLPPPRSWPDRNPEAAARLERAKQAVSDLATEHDLPAENLISPATVRQLAWSPPADVNEESIAAQLESAGARAWQVALTKEKLAEAMSDA